MRDFWKLLLSKVCHFFGARATIKKETVVHLLTFDLEHVQKYLEHVQITQLHLR